MLATLTQVALGGAAGAVARYLTGLGAARLMGQGFPWGTLTVNIVGSAAMGLFVALAAHRGLTPWSPLVMTGFLGGFTTFSAFSLDAITLIERGQTGAAAGYIAASVVLSLGGLVLGLWLGRGLLP